jgi:Zn finger protein HypA/HybF involved in hydrogenase expression
MHELSVIMSVVDTVDEYLKASYADATDGAPAGSPKLPASSGAKITRITLQVGERSTYIPSYIREIWPFAVNGTSLDGAALGIEDIPGKDFLIKEIEVEEPDA